MADKRLTIGLFICHLDNDYAYDICKGVDYAAKELDINLVIFPGMYINAAYNDPANAKYDYQYNSVFYYAKPESIDALIISIGTIGSFLDEKNSIEFLERFGDIPILTLEEEFANFSSLVIDSKTGLKAVINHLIQEHNKKNIGFVSGRQGNSDATERLEIYKSTLAEAGLPVNEDLIVYGNFSEFCEELVEDLLDNHPEIDALCFANDQMALGGYNVLKRRGIEIGTDIAVTGFDDVPLALALEPTLTTVRANACELGYRSVYEALELIKTKEIRHSRLSSSMILRDSCGCSKKSNTEEDLTVLKDMNRDALVEHLLGVMFKNDQDTFICNKVTDSIREYVELIVDTVQDDSTITFPLNKMQHVIKEYISSPLTLYFSVVQLSYALQIMNRSVLPLITDVQKRENYYNVAGLITEQFLNSEASMRYNAEHEYKYHTWTSSYIIRDTMTNSNDPELVYTQIVDKLQKLNLTSSYIFTTNEEIKPLSNGNWHIPDDLRLRAYNQDEISVALTNVEHLIPVKNLFNNNIIPKRRRYTMILTPVFTATDHHGMFLAEIDIADFHHMYSISLELGTTLKFLKMYEEQQQTNQQLEYTLSVLHEKNRQLSKISTVDELTGLKNRRGFLTEAQAVITSAINKGQDAILLFADMDNLKAVNDLFGHEDGDFALRTISTALRTSMRNDDIVGRLGGDEFIAFAMLGNQKSADTIAKRIKNKLRVLNENSEKAYYIESSIGYTKFTCDENIDITDLIKQADEALYEDKSHKRKSIIKEAYKQAYKEKLEAEGNSIR